MKNWTLQEARADFERGLLKQVRLVMIAPDAWAIKITSTLLAEGTGWVMHSRTGEVRHIKKLQAAIDVVAEIGFEIKQLLIE